MNIDEIYVIKLINGEEFIGKILKEEDNRYYVSSAARILIQPDEKSSSGYLVALAPFFAFTTGDKFYLNKNSIALYGEADKQLLNEYNRIFGSGIVVANVMPGA